MSYELSNADCNKGQVTQQPPIPYAVSKNGLLLSTLRETVKIKMPEGESKQSLLGDWADGEEYMKHLMSFFQFMEKKGYKKSQSGREGYFECDYSPEEACKSSTVSMYVDTLSTLGSHSSPNTPNTMYS